MISPWSTGQSILQGARYENAIWIAWAKYLIAGSEESEGWRYILDTTWIQIVKSIT